LWTKRLETEIKGIPQMARKYHPDLNPNNKESEKNSRKSMRLTSMSNTVNRKKYDEYGENWQHADEFESQKTTKAIPRKWSTRF
jgi:curved DNA-binding protein